MTNIETRKVIKHGEIVIEVESDSSLIRIESEGVLFIHIEKDQVSNLIQALKEVNDSKTS